MSCHPRRTVACLAGPFTTAALVSARRRDLRGAARWLAVALLAGILAVAFEEATPDDA
jgi:hypothetical protein